MVPNGDCGGHALSRAQAARSLPLRGEESSATRRPTEQILWVDSIYAAGALIVTGD